MKFKLGKRKASYSRRDLRFAHYLKVAELPPIPDRFGHESLIPSWGMLGNDQVGDCVLAGAAHETMLWNKEAGVDVPFTDAAVLSDYSAITGYNPADPNTDQGTDMRTALDYRRQTGLVDGAGKRHTIAAYVSLEPGNLAHLYAAMYLFGAVGIGIQFPDSAMDQVNDKQPWTVVPGAQIEGGHYIPLVARRDMLLCITWGQVQPLSEQFLSTYCDEAYAMLSPEFFVAGKSIDGFDIAALRADLGTVTAPSTIQTA